MEKIKLNKRNANPFRGPTEVQKTEEGYRLIDPNTAFHPLTFISWILICGVLFSMSTFFLAILIPQPSLETQGLATMIIVACLSVATVMGIVSLIYAAEALYQVYKIQVGEIILSTYPLYRGQTYRIKYRRKLRQGRTTKPTIVTAQWVNYEWVEYRRGTDTVTATHEISVIDLPEQSIMAGVKELTYAAQITVPDDALFSIYAPHNQVRWELRVKIQLPFVAKDTSFFVLKVLPS